MLSNMATTRRGFLGVLGGIAAGIVSGESVLRGLAPDAPRVEKLPEWRRGPTTCVWSGRASAEFANPDNWLGRRVPRNGDSIIVHGSTPTLTLPADLAIDSLYLYGGNVVATN